MLEYDAIAVTIMNQFYFNNFAAADALGQRSYRDDPVVAVSWGCLSAIRAVLSFEQADVNQANVRLNFAAYFGRAVQPPSKGVVGSVMSWFKKPVEGADKITPMQFRSLVCVGESEILRAIVLMTSATYSGYLYSAMALRRAYNTYDRLLKLMEKYPADYRTDQNACGGVNLGIGAIHIITSIMPPRLLSIVKRLGYMHNRRAGFVHIHECLASKSLRSPLASFFLLAFHGMIPSFAILTAPTNLAAAEVAWRDSQAMYPESMLHLWLHGRVQRLAKNAAAAAASPTGAASTGAASPTGAASTGPNGPSSRAVATFKKCIDNAARINNDLPQLRHFALYDLGWTYCSLADWDAARKCFEVLERESAWSKMFYAYAQGVCSDMMAEDAEVSGDAASAARLRQEASAALMRSRRHGVMKLAGKVISVEQFAKRRLKYTFGVPTVKDGTTAASPTSPNGGLALSEEENANFNLPVVPLRRIAGLELAMHFNVLPQTDADKIVQFRILTERWLSTYGRTVDREEAAVVKLLRATIVRETGDLDAAQDAYESLLLEHQESTFAAETWLAPYTTYELAVTQYRQGREAACRETLQKRMKEFSGKDYNFEMPMGFRLHLTNDMFAQPPGAAA